MYIDGLDNINARQRLQLSKIFICLIIKAFTCILNHALRSEQLLNNNYRLFKKLEVTQYQLVLARYSETSLERSLP